MTKKIITWVDLQGRYRVTSPAYDDATRPVGETEDECLERTWAKLVSSGTHNGVSYSIALDHPHFFVEDADQQARLIDCCGSYFRYGAKQRPDKEGRKDSAGVITLCCDARDGAWEMDTDGRPRINMAKARGVHMDCIRACRDAELAAKDITFMRAVEAGDTSAQSTVAAEKQTLRDIPQTFDLTTDNDTPVELKAKWPAELPARE